MNAKKLIIFDYDGTLSDTSPGIMHCYNTAAGELGLPPHTRREDFVGVIGGPLEKGFATLWPTLPESEIPSRVLRYRALYATEGMAQPAPLYKGMRSTLLTLRENGFLLAVATLKHERFIHAMLKENDIDSLFDAVCAYTGVETKRDLLQKAGTLTHVPVKESLLVGDSAYDGQGALAMQMDFAAVLYGWGFQKEADTQPYHPVCTLHTPGELPPLLLAAR